MQYLQIKKRLNKTIISFFETSSFTFGFYSIADAFCGIRRSSVSWQTETLEDGALGADQRRRAPRHHRARPRDGGRVRPLLRHGHRLLRSGARLPAASDGHQRFGTGAAVGAGRVAGQQQPVVEKTSLCMIERQADCQNCSTFCRKEIEECSYFLFAEWERPWNESKHFHFLLILNNNCVGFLFLTSFHLIVSENKYFLFFICTKVRIIHILPLSPPKSQSPTIILNTLRNSDLGNTKKVNVWSNFYLRN